MNESSKLYDIEIYRSFPTQDVASDVTNGMKNRQSCWLGKVCREAIWKCLWLCHGGTRL